MRILVYGARVIGTVYAAKLQEGGHEITVLARGNRLADIRRYGLVIEDMAGARSTIQVKTADRLLVDDAYDAALITVRRDQLASILPSLAANRPIPTLLFMLNNPTGSADLIQALGPDRVLLGFPGAGGTREGPVVRYILIAQQPTTLGEFDGKRTARAVEMADAFRKSGFPTRLSRNMDAWLKTHAFFVTAIGGAIYLSGGDCRRLSEDKATLALMVEGVREGFAVVRALGQAVMPIALKVLFCWLPRAFAVGYWRRFFASETGEYAFGRHVRAAPQEMREVAKDCRSLLEKTGVGAPELLRLYAAIDAYANQGGIEG